MHPLIFGLALAAGFQAAEAAPSATPSLEAEVSRRFVTVCVETGGDWTKVEAAAVALGLKEEQAPGKKPAKQPVKRFAAQWKLDEADATWQASITRLDANVLGPLSNQATDLCSLGRTDKASGSTIAYTRAVSHKP